MTTKNLYFQYFLAYKEHKIWNYANNVYKVFIFCIKKQIGLITLPQTADKDKVSGHFYVKKLSKTCVIWYNISIEKSVKMGC